MVFEGDGGRVAFGGGELWVYGSWWEMVAAWRVARLGCRVGLKEMWVRDAEGDKAGRSSLE